MTHACRRCGWSETSRRLWIVQVVPELPRWIVVTESVDDPNELSVVPTRYASRSDALAALADARERRRILEEHDKHTTNNSSQPSPSTSRRKTSTSRALHDETRADHEHITSKNE